MVINKIKVNLSNFIIAMLSSIISIIFVMFLSLPYLILHIILNTDIYITLSITLCWMIIVINKILIPLSNKYNI
jgi:hypothetical protein